MKCFRCGGEEFAIDGGYGICMRCRALTWLGPDKAAGTRTATAKQAYLPTEDEMINCPRGT